MERLLAQLREWARARADVEAIALVGSWSRGTARPDSDVDLVVITNDPDLYLSSDSWAAGFGLATLLEPVSWGAVTERRGLCGSGLEIEFGITTPSWASLDPIDAGTRRVVTDGMTAVYDPKEVVARLIRAAR